MVIWLASFPRSGNSYFRVVSKTLFDQEIYSVYPENNKQVSAGELEAMMQENKVYLVKTHELPPDSSPAIYLVRDGRDALVSLAWFQLASSVKPNRKISKRKYTKASQGNINVYSFYYSTLYIIKCIKKIITTNPNSIYIGLPKSFLTFFRNAIIIWVSLLLGKTIFSEIHGMSFPFIEKHKWQRKILFNIEASILRIKSLNWSKTKFKLESIGAISVWSIGWLTPEYLYLWDCID